MNAVISGDYKGKTVRILPGGEKIVVDLSLSKWLPIEKETVYRYEVMSQQEESKFSAGKAAVGVAVFGYGGAIVGANSQNIFQVAVYFRNGSKSLLELDSKHFKCLSASLFGVEDYVPSLQPPKKQSRLAGILIPKIIIFFVSVVVCVMIASSFLPVVDGVIQLDGFGTLFVFGVPIILTVIFPIKIKKD